MAYNYSTYAQFEKDLASFDSQYATNPAAAVQARVAAVSVYNSVVSASQAPAYSPPPPPPAPPAPAMPNFMAMQYSNNNIKVAPSDIIQFDDNSVNIARMSQLLFEDIGAVELANISRSDLIDGQETIYSPIKNLSNVRREFNPNNVVATAYSADYFTRFGINLIARGIREPYFNEDGDLVIEVDTVLDGEDIQVEVLSSGIIDLIEES